ncbi:response regulator [Phenylobacterium sp.]|uniref:response regulator n=1 Tax=Phenylobacterium sp. TaxID=1871053 RepID=UPI0025EB0987|nr:response regulator [Phenylobacterium sp.]
MAANALVIDDEDIFIGRSKAKLRTALVIHGEPLVARSLAMILGAEAFIVETASAGAEGVSLAQQAAFDVIILGADLPDMSGLEAMNQLKLAEVTAAVVFASVTPATAAKAAMLHLSDCS